MAEDKVTVLKNTLATIGFRGDPQSHVLFDVEGGWGGVFGGNVLTLATCRISSRVIGYVSNLCALSTHFEFTIHSMQGHEHAAVKQEEGAKQDRDESGRVTIVMSDIARAHAQMMLKPGSFREVYCHPSVTRRRVTMRMESSEMRDLKKNSAMHGDWLQVRFEVNLANPALPPSSIMHTPMHPVVKIGGDGGFLSIRRCVLVAEPCLLITQPVVRGNVHMSGPDEFIRRIAMMSNTKAVGAHFEIKEGVDDIVKEEGGTSGTMIDDMLASARFGAVVGSSNKRPRALLSNSSATPVSHTPAVSTPAMSTPTVSSNPASMALPAGKARRPCTLIVQVNKDGADQVIACPGQLVGAVVNTSPVYMLNTICRILSPFQRNAKGLVFGLGSESEVLWVSIDVRDAKVNALVKSMDGYRKMGLTDSIPVSNVAADSAWFEANTGGTKRVKTEVKTEVKAEVNTETESNPTSPRTLSSSAPPFLHPRAPATPAMPRTHIRGSSVQESGSHGTGASPKGVGGGSTKKS